MPQTPLRSSGNLHGAHFFSSAIHQLPALSSAHPLFFPCDVDTFLRLSGPTSHPPTSRGRADPDALPLSRSGLERSLLIFFPAPAFEKKDTVSSSARLFEFLFRNANTPLYTTLRAERHLLCDVVS